MSSDYALDNARPQTERHFGARANWLARTTGPTGSVLAADLDLRWLRNERLPRVSAKVHDVVNDKAPTYALDLVHLRLILVHLHQRRQVLARSCGRSARAERS